MESPPKLTKMQRKFVEAFLADTGEIRGKPARAAVVAGYSEKGATVTASRMLKHTGIVAALKIARAAGGKLPPEPAPLPAADDPMAMLMAVMNSWGAPIRQRIDAARTLMAYMHPRMGETGKKEAAQHEAAKQAVDGKFKPAASPRLLSPVAAGS